MSDIVFVNNLDTDVTSYLSANNLLKKDGSLYKNVTVKKIKYTHPSTSYVFDATSVERKGITTIFIKNVLTVEKSKLSQLFNSLSNFDLCISNTTINNPRFEDNQLTSYGKTFIEAETTPIVANFISWLRTDNSNIAEILIEKFLYITRVTKNYLLTGYADVELFFSMLKKKSSFNLGANLISINDNITFSLSLDLSNKLVLSTTDMNLSVNSTRMYLLFTTKPINFSKETLPYVAKYSKGTSIFVSPFMGKAGIDLTKIKGGVNLLK